ncbi:MAG: SCO family protein [Gammaproteobacteria bacterium]|nr:SCO family protein [Gammaproteobacteria bacterium]
MAVGLATGSDKPVRRKRMMAGLNAIPNVPVLTHEGESVRFYDDLVKDRVVTFNAMYMSCGDSCPLITQNLRYVQDLLGDRAGRDIFMYSITLQPETDTVQALQSYAKLFRVKPGWKFITGKPEHIEELRFALGFYDRDPVVDALYSQHTGILRFGNERLRRWAGCPAMARPAAIVATITSSMSLPDASTATI